ncbi:MAG: ABC transporter permease [Desulfurococcales archaeon]|nr:ABC transporter permease [Desulfurococcales archaeon]
MRLAAKILREAALVGAALMVGLAIGGLVAVFFDAPPLGFLVDMVLSARHLPDMVVEYTALLALTATAFAIPLHAGLFNIGAEGSFYAGALVALMVGVKTGSLLLALLLGTLAGVIVTGVAGALRVWLGVNEVLSTIMINWVMYWVMLYLVVDALADPVFTQRTVKVPREARLPWINVAGVDIPSTIIVSAVIIVGVWVFLRMTRYGLLLRVVGANEEAARMRGVNVGLYRLASMLIAGGLAGLAGSLHIVGFSYSIDVLGGTVRNYGFNGIGVALMGRNDPLGILAASLLFSSLLAGSQVVEPIYKVPKEAADLVIGIVIILLSAPTVFTIIRSRLGGGR